MGTRTRARRASSCRLARRRWSRAQSGVLLLLSQVAVGRTSRCSRHPARSTNSLSSATRGPRLVVWPRTPSITLTVVVTTSTLVRLRPSLAKPHRVKRPVSSLPGELVCSVVPRRPRTKRFIDGNGGGVGLVLLPRCGCASSRFGSSRQRVLCSLAEVKERTCDIREKKKKKKKKKKVPCFVPLL